MLQDMGLVKLSTPEHVLSQLGGFEIGLRSLCVSVWPRISTSSCESIIFTINAKLIYRILNIVFLCLLEEYGSWLLYTFFN